MRDAEVVYISQGDLGFQKLLQKFFLNIALVFKVMLRVSNFMF